MHLLINYFIYSNIYTYGIHTVCKQTQVALMRMRPPAATPPARARDRAPKSREKTNEKWERERAELSGEAGVLKLVAAETSILHTFLKLSFIALFLFLLLLFFYFCHLFSYLFLWI